ncbi:MAG TPA: protein kinase, partial [Gemmataceae bacterium]
CVLKITDFGLAKKVEDAGQTATGVVMGTPSYMAPEQTSGDSRRIDPAVDIYALGAILYELLTGRPPFRAATPVETILQVQHNEPVPPRQLQPRTPRDVETIGLKCLHKEASRRYATAADLAADLGRFLRDEPIEARPVGWTERAAKWVRRRPAAASLLAVAVATPLIALALAGWYLNRKEQFNEQLSEINKRLETERNTALEKKELAERSEAKANQREKEANEQKKLAQEATRDSQLRLMQMHVATGVRLMEDGDALTALPWLVAALKEDPSAAATREMHRYRIGALLRQSPRLVRLFFQRPSVIGAEFSPDGRHLLAASSDGTARVWDIAKGGAFPPPPRQPPSLSSAAFSPDGRLAVTADRDRYAKVWEAATGQVVATLKHDKGLNGACFSPDGRRVLTASDDETARIWDARTGQPLGQPLRHGGQVVHVAFSPDGRLVATASSNNTARIWNALTGKLLGPDLQHNGIVLHVAFSPDGKRVVSASRDNRVRVWEVATGKLLFTFSHNNLVYKAFFSPDGGRIVSCSMDFTARLWNAATGQPIGQPLKHGAAVYHASFSPDGSRVVTTGEDLTARVWNALTGELAVPPLKHPQVVTNATFGPDGRILATCCSDGIVRIWELTEEAPALARTFADKIHGLSPDTRLALTVAADGTARFWNTSTGREADAPWRIAVAVRHVAFSSDSRRLIVACADQTARVWDVAAAREIGGPRKHNQSLTAAFLSDDGRQAATCCGDQSVHVWDVSDGQEVCPPLMHPGQPYHVQFSGDGRRVLTASRSGPGKAHLWDATTGRPLGDPLVHLPLESSWNYADIGPVLSPAGDRVATRTGNFAGQIWDVTTEQRLGSLLLHNGGLSFLCFSPDGRRLLSTSNDCTAWQWDAVTGRRIAPALRHLHWVRHGAYSADGRRIATAGFDNRARVWDSATGLPLTPPLKSNKSLDRVRFRPDGLRLLNWNTSDLLAWNVSRDDRPLEDLLKLTNLLAGHQLDAHGGLVPLTQDDSRQLWQDLYGKYPQDFHFTAPDLPSLHLQKAKQFSTSRQWTNAIHHYDKAIELGAKNPDVVWQGRAMAFAQLQQWDKALADLERLRERQPENHYVWFQMAPLLLRLGDVKGHRRHCQEMLQRFGQSQAPSVAEHVAKACLLHSGSAEEIDPAARLMIQVLRAGANHRDRFYFEVTKGLADYRQREFRAAEERLDKLLRNYGKLHWSVSVPGHLVL